MHGQSINENNKRGIISMTSKKLQASVIINEGDSNLPKDIKEICLEYYIVEGVVQEDCEGYNGKIYGIEILKKETDRKNTTFMENILVKDISCSKSYVEEVANILARHTVTPITIKEILGDIIGTSNDIQLKSITSVA